MEQHELEMLLDAAYEGYTESGASMELDVSLEDFLCRAYEKIEAVYQLSIIEF